MKKTAKTWLILAVCLVLTGCVLFTVTLGAAGWDLSALGTEKMETEEVIIEEGFYHLAVRSDTEDIVFQLSEDDMTRVVFCEPEKRQCSALVANGTLMIEARESRSWLERFSFFNYSSPKITVYLPHERYGSLIIEESMGDIALPKDFSFEGIQITVSTGDIDCAASARGDMRIKTSTGDIRLESVSAQNIELTVTTGKVELRNVECELSMSVNVSTGKTKATNVFCGSFRSEGGTGNIELVQIFAREEVNLKRSTGDVMLSAVQAKEIVIETTTGDVTAALSSQIIVTASSKTGRIEVPKTNAGDKRCSITTTTGDIIVTDLPR